MNAMRYVIAVLGVLLVVAGLASVKGKQIGQLIAAGKQFEKQGPPPEAVSTAVADEQAWEGTIFAVGSIAPVKGVAVSNDAAGVVSAIRFESGAVVRQGQVLVELDSRVERAQLASTRARQELADLSVKRSRALVQSNTIAQAQLDSDEFGFKTLRADVTALEAQIDRKVVRAPFSGRLGIRQINLGQYLNPGSTVAVLEAVDSVYVDFALPQQRLADVSVGMPVHVAIDGSDAKLPDGTIAAIDPSIDSTTRTIKGRASVPNKDEKLRPGMFVNVSVVLPQKAPVVTVPQTALVHASYGDSVFVVEPSKDDASVTVARQQFVKVGERRGDFIAIADGIKRGETVVAIGGFKLRNGAKVVVKNDVKPEPKLAPSPENR
jgi:membrane fusion protein (multidrug efflux system)